MTMTLAERRAEVANLRARGLTQVQVAEHLQVAQSVVSRDEAAHADRTAPVDLPSAPHGGACVDADIESFFPVRGEHADPALRICLTGPCPVLDDCAVFAMGSPTFDGPSTGVVGGMSAPDRHAVKMGRTTVAECHRANRERLGLEAA